jgi:hypothetical protein
MTEIWYARLLRLYPADHPRDEMLDVLLTSGRPCRREVLPLTGAANAGDWPGERSRPSCFTSCWSP